MNKIVKHPATDRMFADHFFSVESVTAEGASYSFARIYHNKHGRTNLTGIGYPKFYAGSKNRADVVKYARHVDPNTTEQVFIERGRVRVLRPAGVAL